MLCLERGAIASRCYRLRRQMFDRIEILPERQTTTKINVITERRDYRSWKRRRRRSRRRCRRSDIVASIGTTAGRSVVAAVAADRPRPKTSADAARPIRRRRRPARPRSGCGFRPTPADEVAPALLPRPAVRLRGGRGRRRLR